MEEFRRTSSVLYDDWDNFCITLGWDRIIISGVVCPENEKFLGMRVTELPRNSALRTPLHWPPT